MIGLLHIFCINSSICIWFICTRKELIDNYLLGRMHKCNGTLIERPSVIPAFHQGKITSIDKLKRGIALEGDMNYNAEKMKKDGEKKECLYRSASYLLCLDLERL